MARTTLSFLTRDGAVTVALDRPLTPVEYEALARLVEDYALAEDLQAAIALWAQACRLQVRFEL